MEQRPWGNTKRRWKTRPENEGVDALAAFKLSPLFRHLDRRALRALAQASKWRECRGGEYLFRVGEAGDALYLVANGRVRINRPGVAGIATKQSEIGLGQTAGEMSVVTGETHTADALTLRDSRLLRIAKQDFDRVVARHPEAMLGFTRLIVQRLRNPELRRPREILASARTYALLPGHPGIDIAGFARAFAAETARLGSTLRLDAQRTEQALGEGAATATLAGAGNYRLVAWLNQLEDRYRYLVYQAEDAPEPWTQRCLRQADRILVVVDAGREPEVGATVTWLQQADLQAPVELVLLQPEEPQPGNVAAWRAATGAGFHYHVPASLKRAALARAVRLLCGRGLCLVLGGGGARGFAHAGLLRALEERAIPVDAIGGTSMGALVAAMVACGMDVESLLEALRETFVDNNFLNDYSFSRIALINGQKFRRRLEDIFGDTRIEDLAIPFFCESTNLSRGTNMIHAQGRLVDWVSTSMAVPGIAPPVVYRGSLLVDGGRLRSIPFDTMHAWGRGPIVVSDVSSETDLRLDGGAGEAPVSLLECEGRPNHINIFKILFQSATLTSETESRDLDQRADLVLHMPVDGVGMFDWDQLDAIVYRAYHYADEALDRWLERTKPASVA